MNEKLSKTLDEKWLEKLKNRYLLTNSEKDLRAYERAKSFYDVESKGRSDYERGLNDIWEALKVFALMGCTNREVYYHTIPSDVSGSLTTTLYNLTPQEFMDKHKAAMKKMEEEKAEAAEIRRGDKVRCIGRCDVNFDAIYLGEDERFHHIVTRDNVPQVLNKTNGWTLIKYEGQHVDLDSLLG